MSNKNGIKKWKGKESKQIIDCVLKKVHYSHIKTL